MTKRALQKGDIVRLVGNRNGYEMVPLGSLAQVISHITPSKFADVEFVDRSTQEAMSARGVESDGMYVGRFEHIGDLAQLAWYAEHATVVEE